jgi:hypothetical protein
MKQLLTILLCLFGLFGRSQPKTGKAPFNIGLDSKTDTTYFHIGFNATMADGRTFDGFTSLYCLTEFPTLKDIEDFIMSNNKHMTRIVVLSLFRFKNKRESEIFYSRSNFMKKP